MRSTSSLFTQFLTVARCFRNLHIPDIIRHSSRFPTDFGLHVWFDFLEHEGHGSSPRQVYSEDGNRSYHQRGRYSK